MIRGRWIWDKERCELVPADEYQRPVPKRSTLACPMLNLDTMPETKSMLDGKLYTSKSKLRQTYREAGVVEVGDDPQRYKPREKPKPDRKKIKEAIGKAQAEFNAGRRFDPRPVAD